MDYRGRGRLDGRPDFPKVGWRSEHWSKSIVEGRDCRNKDENKDENKNEYHTIQPLVC